MSFDPTATTVVNGGSGLLLLAVAIFVYTVAPRERPNLAFALFSGGWGIRQATIYTGLSFTPGDEAVWPFVVVTVLADVAYVSGLLLMAAWFPTRLARGQRRAAVLPIVVALVLALAGAWAFVQDATRDGLGTGLAGPSRVLIFAAILVNTVFAFPGLMLLTLLLATRFHALRPDETRARSQILLLTAAIATYAGMISGALPIGAPAPPMRAVGFLMFASMLLLAALWLRNAGAARDPDARHARNLAWYVLAVQLVGLVAAIPRVDTPGFASGPQFGISRVVVVLVVAYAVVRHQMLGVDLKVRWGISKTTVAAAFIGAFFVVSEGAAAFFEDRTDSRMLGIAAAGALVFAIAPLQRVADRIAEKAVPVAASSPAPAPAPSVAPDRALLAYRAAVHAALADGRMTPAEEDHLAEVAHQLALSPRDALRIRREVERAVTEVP